MSLGDSNLNMNIKEQNSVRKREFRSLDDDGNDDDDDNGDNAPTSSFCKSSGRHISKKNKLFLCGSNQNDAKFLEFKVNENYSRISANPELLPETPVIFEKLQDDSKATSYSDSFLPNLLSAGCFNSDRMARFTNLKVVHMDGEEKNMQKKTQLDFGIDYRNKNDRERTKESNSNSFRKEKKKGKRKVTNVKFESGVTAREEGNNMIDTYSALHKNALILHMHHPSSFSFQGEIKITLLKGEVEILGYTLHQSSENKSVDAYSPNFCTPLIVDSKPPKESETEETVQSRLKDILSEDNIKMILTKMNPNDSILLVEQIISTFGLVINKYFDKTLFPKDLDDFSSISKTITNIQSIFQFSPLKRGKGFRKNPEWDKITLGQCTVLAGGKGVGKSTLLKYYVNKLVTQKEKVLCLDFDPGQPEFTVPGSLSLIIVENALLGPNFTHVTDPKLSIYFGDIDVARNPTRYLQCVNYIIEYCKTNQELLNMKWLVNTMGFNKGLGVNLMVTILKLLQPSTVIQIKSSDMKKNYPFYLTPMKVNSLNGFKLPELKETCLNFDLHMVYSCAERKKKSVQSSLTPRQLRDIMSISYFSRMTSPPFYNFNAVQPYLISFSKLYLGIDSLIALNDILKAFNGNIVSLLHFEPRSEEIYVTETEEENYFKIVIKPELMPCLGIGFVRGIDCIEKKFYVMTHLSIEDLEKINCLSLGRISPPHSMFLKQDQIEGQAVYTSVSTFDVVQRVKRMFRVPDHLK